MAVESATKIHELNSAAPTGAEPLSEADDHLRVIKTAVKGSFPGFGVSADSGAYTGGADELNALAGLVDGSGLNALTIGAGLTGTSYNASAPVTIAVDFTDARISKSVPVTLRNAATTLNADYANEIVYSTDSTARTYTVSDAIAIGDHVQVHNAGSANITLDAGGNTLKWLNGASVGTGNRTVVPGGIATLVKVASGTFHVYGGGIS
jgi:hypothetical protein